MPQRTARTRSARRSLALSLFAHACALAALVCFAPLATRPEREEAPLTVRFVPHLDRPAEAPAAPRPSDRGALPDEQPFAPIPIERLGDEELQDESDAIASELPAEARRSPIGVGGAAALRVPHPRVTATAAPGSAPALAAAAAPLAGALAPAEESTPPVPLECLPPEYPAGAATVSEGGRVRLEILVGSDGRVESVRVLRSSGFARLDEAAEDGVRKWRFKPARRAGSAVAWRLEHTIVFRVETGR